MFRLKATCSARLAHGTPIASLIRIYKEVAVIETLSPNIPKAMWIDRCMTSIGKLKPEVSIQEAHTVALNILWSEDTDTLPEQAAAAWARDDTNCD
jgi:hypothetical protein